MKHMNRIYAGVATGAIATESIAMEGMGEWFKEGWTALKAKVKPTDSEHMAEFLAMAPKYREAIKELKSAVSSMRNGESVSKSVKKLSSKFPVSASTPEELVRNLAAWRKNAVAMIVKIKQTKTEEEYKVLKDKLAVEFAKKGQLADTMVFTRENALKIIDEMAAMLDVTEDLYKWLVDNKKNVAQEGIAMESADTDIESIAMEGFWKKFFGWYFLITGYCDMFGAALYGLLTIGALFASAWPLAVTYGVSAAIYFFIGKFFKDVGSKWINEERGGDL